MKRASTLRYLFDRTTPWLAWWQELILNWVASWETIENLHVTSSRTDDEITWNIPSDWDLVRMELEELLDVESGQR
jgi:hypothetical protein